MTVGEALLLYAVLVGTLGPVALRRVRWPQRAPKLGAAAVLALACSCLLALLTAGLTLILPTNALTMDVGRLIGACLVRLRAAYATPGGAAAVAAGQALSAGLAGRILWVAGRQALIRRTERRRNQLLIRLAGRRLPSADAVVLDSPGAVAYSIAGRHPTVVVTSGAVAALSHGQLGAVLAHEAAHLQARHHRRLAAAALLARTLPSVPLLRETPRHVGRLLEMEADELAARQHEPRILAGALVAVGTAGPSRVDGRQTWSPRSTAGGDAAARIRRLLRPPEQLPRRRRALARAGVVGLTAGPVLIAAVPGLLTLR